MNFSGDPDWIGRTVPVRITDANPNSLRGELLDRHVRLTLDSGDQALYVSERGPSMQIEMTIKGLMVDPITNMPIIILRDKDGQRVLPIWVGVFEANAIALQIENVTTPRPMTHDLLRNVIHDLQGRHPEDRRLRPEGEHVLRADLPVGQRGADGDRRPAERRDRAGAAGAGARSSSRTRSSTTPRPSTSPPRRGTPSGCRSGWKASIRTTWASTRCSVATLELSYSAASFR